MSAKFFLRRCATWIAFLLMAVILLSFTGQVFALGNSLAVIRFPVGLLLVALLPLLFWLNARAVLACTCIVAMMALLPLAMGYFKPNPVCEGACLTLYQKNLMSKSWPRAPLTEEILASGAEVVTLQEVSDHNRKFMAELFDAYPFSVTCKFRPEQDTAVLTTLPVVEGSAFCLEGAGLTGMQVITEDQKPLWVVSIHLEWPFPFNQFQQVARVEEHLRSLQGPILIGGDFNMVTWGGSVTRVAKAARAKTFGPYRNTYLSGGKFLPLPIDNVLVPEAATGHLERRPRLASDHLGLLARISLP